MTSPITQLPQWWDIIKTRAEKFEYISKLNQEDLEKSNWAAKGNMLLRFLFRIFRVIICPGFDPVYECAKNSLKLFVSNTPLNDFINADLIDECSTLHELNLIIKDKYKATLNPNPATTNIQDLQNKLVEAKRINEVVQTMLREKDELINQHAKQIQELQLDLQKRNATIQEKDLVIQQFQVQMQPKKTTPELKAQVSSSSAVSKTIETKIEAPEQSVEGNISNAQVIFILFSQNESKDEIKKRWEFIGKQARENDWFAYPPAFDMKNTVGNGSSLEPLYLDAFTNALTNKSMSFGRFSTNTTLNDYNALAQQSKLLTDTILKELYDLKREMKKLENNPSFKVNFHALINRFNTTRTLIDMVELIDEYKFLFQTLKKVTTSNPTEDFNKLLKSVDGLSQILKNFTNNFDEFSRLIISRLNAGNSSGRLFLWIPAEEISTYDYKSEMIKHGLQNCILAKIFPKQKHTFNLNIPLEPFRA